MTKCYESLARVEFGAAIGEGSFRSVEFTRNKRAHPEKPSAKLGG